MTVTQPIELKITMMPGGEVQVNGPIHDKFFCYALLESARDAIKDFKPAETSRIVPAGLIPPFTNGRG